MPRAPSPSLTRHWPALALAVVAGAVAAWAHHRIYPALSFNRDEAVYLWQLDTLRDGRLTSVDGGHPELFLPWLSAARDGMLFSQYTLGWALVMLAADITTGSPSAALYVGAGLAVLGTYAFAWEITRSRPPAIIAAAIMVGSPIMAIQGGVHLSYLFTLGLGLLFGVGLLSGLRTGRMGRVVAGGVALGAIFFTRPYDGLLWGLAFGLYAIVAERHRWRELVRPFLLVGAGALPLVLATLAYNRHVTGAPLAFPITEADPLDTFGFGERRLMPGFPTTDYTLGSGLYALAKHAFFFPWFLAGSYLGLGLAGAGLWWARRRQSTLLIVLVAVVFPLGYLPFWGTWVSSEFTRISGAIYFLSLYAAVAVLMAIALVELHRRRPRLTAGLVIALVLATIPTAVSRFSINHELSVRQEPWRTSVDAIDGEAIVFVGDSKRYLLFLNPFGANGPTLDDRLLYSVELDPGMLDLIAEQPDRTPFMQVATAAQEDLGPKEDPEDFDVVLLPVEVRRGPLLELAVTAEDPEHHAVTTIELEAAGRSIRRSVPDGTPLPPITIGPPGSAADLPLPDRGVLRITLGHGDTEADALRSPTAQHRMVFRAAGADLEVLLPPARYDREVFGDHTEWRRRLTTPELVVEITPTNPPPSG